MDFADNKPYCGVFAAYGIGKTLTALAHIERNQFNRILVISSKTAVESTWVDEIRRHSDFRAVMMLGTRQQKLASLDHGMRISRIDGGYYHSGTKYPTIFLLNFDGVRSVFNELVKWGRDPLTLKDIITGSYFDFVVVDECFIAGTKIKTLAGEKNIEEIKVGEYVFNAADIGRVKRISKREYWGRFVKIKFSNGCSFICTENHPIFTQDGWIEAQHLLPGKIVFDYSSLRDLWNGIYAETDKTQGEILRAILLSEMENDKPGMPEEYLYEKACGENKCGIEGKVQKIYGMEQRCNYVGRESAKVFRYIEKNRPSSANTRRQWKTGSETAKHFVGNVGKGLDFGVCIENEYTGRPGKVFTQSLQAGYSKSAKDAGRSSGRLFTQDFKSAFDGRAQEETIGNIRVETVEIYERGDFEKCFCGQGKDRTIYVYNLEIDNHPSFFAGEVLVHNSTKIKDPTTLRSKVIWELAKYVPNRWVMTGWPVTENVSDFYSQIRFLDLGVTFGKKYLDFMDEYFVKIGYGYKVRKKSVPKILEKIKPFCIHVTNEHLKLPPSIYKTVSIDQTPEQLKLLTDLKEEFRTEFGKVKIDTQFVFAILSRSLQICNGFIQDSKEEAETTCAYCNYRSEDNKVKHRPFLCVRCGGTKHKEQKLEVVPCNKDEALFDLLEDIDIYQNKVVIWFDFVYPVNKIAYFLKKQKIPVLTLTGATDNPNLVVNQFQRTKRYNVLLATLKKASESITLTGAKYAIYYGSNWSGDLRQNSEARIRRKGSEHHESIIYTDLITKNSVEGAVYKCLKQKSDLISTLKTDFMALE